MIEGRGSSLNKLSQLLLNLRNHAFPSLAENFTAILPPPQQPQNALSMMNGMNFAATGTLMNYLPQTCSQTPAGSNLSLNLINPQQQQQQHQTMLIQTSNACLAMPPATPSITTVQTGFGQQLQSMGKVFHFCLHIFVGACGLFVCLMQGIWGSRLLC